MKWTNVILIPLLAVAISLSVGLYVWRRRDAKGAAPLAMILLAAAQWSLGYAFELASVDLEAKIFWDNVQFLGYSIIAPATLIFALQYTERETWLKPWVWMVLIAEPLFTNLLAWTNSSHGLIRRNTLVDNSAPLAVLTYDWGPWMQITVTYEVFVLTLPAIVLLAIRFINTPRSLRGQIGAILIGLLIPWLGGLLTTLGLIPLDLSPLTFTLGFSMIAWGLFRHSLLRFQPVTYKTIIDHVVNGVILLDTQKRVIEINPIAEQMVGLTAVQAIDQPIAELLPDHPELLTYFDSVRKREAEIALEIKGHSRCFDLYTMPLRDSLETINGWLLVLHDVTERKRAEMALRESEKNLARAQEIGHLGSWSLDYVQNKVKWSDEMYRLLGFTPGDPPEPTFELGFSRVHPEDRDALQAVYERSEAEGESGFETEFRTVPIDGQIRTHRVVTEIERDVDGVVTRIFGINSDITARKRVEEALRRSEESFRQLFEANPFPLLISRREDGEILMANQAAADYMNLPLEELIGKTTLSFYADPDERRSIMQDLERHDKVANRVVRARTLSGDPRVMLLNMITLEHEDDLALLTGVADVTAQVEAEKIAQAAQVDAEQANRAKSAFLANMSHELRTPLNAVLGYSELMMSDANLTPEQRENVRTVLRNGGYLLALVNDVLSLSKIEAGKVDLRPQVFDLYGMFQSLERMFLLQAEQRGLTLRFEMDGSVPRYVRADVGKLRQVLINLLGNAVKFVDRGGITMTVSGNEKSKVEERETEEVIARSVLLHFEIEDTGIGIASDELEKVFEAFEQTESGQRSRQGTGLGLPISREYVQMMGGELRVTSEVGVGSCFSFDIPVEVMDVALVPDAWMDHHVIGLIPGQPTYKLLVVDDTESIRQLLVKLLRPLGFDVREAVDGQEALEIWQSWQPGFIFMDMRMPRVDGRQATRRIRALPQGQEVVIIALTASTFEEDQEEILAQGCDDVILKPFLADKVFSMLERHLGVQFVYEGAGEPMESAPILDDGASLDVELDPKWVAEMRQATIEGDIQWMGRLIARIKDTNPAIAGKLTRLAHDFAHSEILEWLENMV